MTEPTPRKLDVRNTVIPAPIYLPQGMPAPRKAFMRGQVRKAFFDYLSLAQSGLAEAQSVVAFMYLLGYVDNCDRLRIAEFWGQQAAGHGDAYGHFVMAWIVLESDRFEEGLSHMMSAAEFEFLPALFHLASFAMNGIILPRNHRQAISLLEIAALRGHRSARTAMAMMYRSGAYGFTRRLQSYFQIITEPLNRLLRLILLSQTSERELVYVYGVEFENRYRQTIKGENADSKLVIELGSLLDRIRSR